MQLILEQARITSALTVRKDASRGRKIGILGAVFGCWHKRITRPFADNKNSYVACLECGARRDFDTKNFRLTRAFYYPTSTELYASDSRSA